VALKSQHDLNRLVARLLPEIKIDFKIKFVYKVCRHTRVRGLGS
jgi:hypothetical protein